MGDGGTTPRLWHGSPRGSVTLVVREKKREKKRNVQNLVQFSHFFFPSALFVNGSLQSVNLLMPNILADIIGCN